MFARTILVAVAMASAVQAQSTTCAACAVLLALSEQLSGNYSSNPDVECQTLGYCSGECTLFNGTWPAASPYWPTDGGVVDTRRLSSEVEGGVDKPSAADFTADAVHQYLKAVKAMEATQGSMTFTDVITGFARSLSSGVLSAEKLARLGRGVSGWTSGNGTDNPCDGGLDITCDINRVFDLHLPLTDGDNDTFAGSDAGSFLNDHFRGADWRGKDCNDSDSNIYPGRQADAYPPTVDHNCNGIFGVDQSSGQPYEQLYCSGSNAPMGLAILGDSAAAHFHLPPQYLNARSFNWSGVLELAANEADWPQCSWSTGFRNASDCPAVRFLANKTAQSIYSRMVERNKCIHRDYQNLGVNGARTGSMAPADNGIVTSFSRDQQNDAPMLVIYALIGNDVCNGHPGSDSMTTVQEFQANVLAALTYLDTVLPKGSHVAFLGLADGRVLYNTTHTLIHPIGTPYPDIYDCLSCNGANPCWGWLNTNETWRNFTSDRAQNLTDVYDAIIATNSSLFQNFDMFRLQVDWVQLIEQYVAAGGVAMDVIEPLDGFHPSQTGNYLLADVIWNDLLTNRPGWLPSINPNNDAITATFGDQGGY